MQGLRFPSAAMCTGVVVVLLALCSYPATEAQRRRGGGGGGEVVSKEKRDYYEGDVEISLFADLPACMKFQLRV
jgi:hypothetical protein